MPAPDAGVYGPKLPDFDDVLAAQGAVQLGTDPREFSAQVTACEQTTAAWNRGIDHRQAAVLAEQEAAAEAG